MIEPLYDTGATLPAFKVRPPPADTLGMTTYSSADIDRFIREQPIRDANAAAKAKRT